MNQIRIVLAAGGTGGHIFPALSLAETLTNRGHQVLYITDTRGIGLQPMNKCWEVECIASGNPNRRGIIAKIKAVWNLLQGIFIARSLIRKFSADIVVGFGGYPSVAPILGAIINRKPVVLHEQNAILGRANRWLSLGAKVIASSFDVTSGLRNIDTKVVKTGNPVRSEIINTRTSKYPAINSQTPFSILVTGGSMGARVLSEIVPAAVALLPKNLGDQIIITQQCREEDQVSLEAKYEKINQKYEIKTFFNDISIKIKNAHLVVSRAGASTVAELGVVGRPAIFIPYRFAMDDHQTMNANAMVMAGGAWCFNEAELTPSALATSIKTILDNKEVLISKAAAARSFGMPDAVNRLADLVFITLEKNTGKTKFETLSINKTVLNRLERLGEKL